MKMYCAYLNQQGYMNTKLGTNGYFLLILYEIIKGYNFNYQSNIIFYKNVKNSLMACRSPGWQGRVVVLLFGGKHKHNMRFSFPING